MRHPMSNQPTGTTFPIGSPVDSALLARIPTLPAKPAPVELSGPRVRLVAMEPQRDAAPLFAVSNGEPIQIGERSIDAYDAATIIWRYLRYGPFKDAAECQAYLVDLGSASDIRPMTLIEKQSNQPIGTLSFMANSP